MHDRMLMLATKFNVVLDMIYVLCAQIMDDNVMSFIVIFYSIIMISAVITLFEWILVCSSLSLLVRISIC